MEVILLENIKKLGKIGSKVKVANGFARNYLLKNNKALVASKENLAIFEKRKDELNKKNNDLKNDAVKIQKEIDKDLVTEIEEDSLPWAAGGDAEAPE
jgi:large subunit ribosomal protein L9